MAKGSKVFTVMVVGDNPSEMMEKYNANLKVEKYIKYKYLDADKMKNNSIKVLDEILKDPNKFNMNQYQIDSLKDRIKQLKSMSTFDYYSELTRGLYIDNNGDAWSDENPNGKWQTCSLGNNFSTPLKLKNGGETNSACVRDIDWDALHLQNTQLYDAVWDLVHHVREPLNDEEKVLLDNMSDKTNYFARFKNKDEYVIHSCAYWNYAYLDENGWVDMDDGNGDIDWISHFYEIYCAHLSKRERVTIFECTKDKTD